MRAAPWVVLLLVLLPALAGCMAPGDLLAQRATLGGPGTPVNCETAPYATWREPGLHAALLAAADGSDFLLVERAPPAGMPFTHPDLAARFGNLSLLDVTLPLDGLTSREGLLSISRFPDTPEGGAVLHVQVEDARTAEELRPLVEATFARVSPADAPTRAAWVDALLRDPHPSLGNSLNLDGSRTTRYRSLGATVSGPFDFTPLLRSLHAKADPEERLGLGDGGLTLHWEEDGGDTLHRFYLRGIAHTTILQGTHGGVHLAVDPQDGARATLDREALLPLTRTPGALENGTARDRRVVPNTLHWDEGTRLILHDALVRNGFPEPQFHSLRVDAASTGPGCGNGLGF